ncbi:MAG: HD-GYP domain-containing protein [Elusimicrobiota bacterium]|nr:HD-GYP domain-containing protein [Elusimicrobiota bacterium]
MNEKEDYRPKVTLYRCTCRHCDAAEEQLRKLSAQYSAVFEVQRVDRDERLRGFAGWNTPIVAIDGVGVTQFKVDAKAWEETLRKRMEAGPSEGCGLTHGGRLNPSGEMAMVAPPRGRAAWIAATFAFVVILHWATPAGPHEWHWLHLAAQKLMFVPVLMCAAWFGLRETLAAAALVSAAFGLHIAAHWRGLPMVQADQLAELVNLWVVAPAAWAFFRVERAAAERLRRAHADTLLTLVSSLELRERYTAGHSRRVAAYSLLSAERMGLRDPAFVRTLETGALLHDAGKIGVPDAALLKTGALNDEEWEAMRRHPESGAALARGSDALEGAAPIIVAHHERYDGRGYPAGLAGAAIPLGARIVAVADVYDALTTARPYKRAFSHDEATVILCDQAGTALDPQVVKTFITIPFHALSEAAGRHGVVLRERTP